ncbi:MAG: hypothetical protein B6I26_03585 [Desulfobacteraceae bacterium 4572_130]|nr:MAG: hypothetical protein B6I26_03585 [Desulfobacteraceae bacterium 4572_130]
MRKITSLTGLVSFFTVLITGIILYVVPHGRIAYWTNWQFCNLSKEQWGNFHINVGVLFLLSITFHIYYNWKSILKYLTNKSKQFKVFTKEFNIALIITMIFIVGTYVEIPPFSTIIKISGEIKNIATKKYGEPPYGHAESSSLKKFTKQTDIDLNAGMILLKQAGLKVENSSQTLKEIAAANNVSPQKLYLIMISKGNKSKKNKKMLGN